MDIEVGGGRSDVGGRLRLSSRLCVVLFLLLALAACRAGQGGRPYAAEPPRGGFDTWEDLAAYIEGRHELIREFAEDSPEALVSPAISLKRGVRPAELRSLLEQHGMPEPSSVRFSSGETTGVIPGVQLGLNDGGMGGSMMNRPSVDKNAEIYYFTVTMRADGLVELIDNEPLLAMAYADDQIGRLRGEATGETSLPPEPITDAYQRLAPRHDDGGCREVADGGVESGCQS